MQSPTEDATLVGAVDALSPATPTRKLLSVLATALLVVGATVGVLVANPPEPHLAPATAVSVGTGVDISVCYDSYEDSQINEHFATIRQRFSGVRTFQTDGFRNAIDAAADAGLKIYAGVRTDENNINADMQAVVDGVKRNPKIVKGVYVGNEELANGISQQTVIDRVKQMKQKLLDAGYGSIPVGSVQVDRDWFGASDLAAACDILGATIQPFFSNVSEANSTTNPLGDLDTRWKALYAKFGSKVVLTATGWPTSGEDYDGHKPSLDTAKSFYAQFQSWARNNGGEMPSFYVFNDNPNKSPEYQATFGMAWKNGTWKFDADPAVKNVVFISTVYDRVLAETTTGEVEFHYRFEGKYWMNDGTSFWSIRGYQIYRWNYLVNTNYCLDAAAPQDGAEIAVLPCDLKSINQQWSYDSSTAQLRHAKHVGFCLDLASPTTAKPRLWTCHDVNSQYYPLQKLDAWLP